MASAEISNDYDVAVSWYYDISWWFFDYCVFVLNAPFSISNFHKIMNWMIQMLSNIPVNANM